VGQSSVAIWLREIISAGGFGREHSRTERADYTKRGQKVVDFTNVIRYIQAVILLRFLGTQSGALSLRGKCAQGHGTILFSTHADGDCGTRPLGETHMSNFF